MRYLSVGTALAATMLSVMAAQAVERTLIDRVRGWEIERNVGAADAHPCRVSKSYRDNRGVGKVVVVALAEDSVALSLDDRSWAWDKDDAPKVPLLLDDAVVTADPTWDGDGTTLSTRLPDALMPRLVAARGLALRFEDRDAEFDLTGLPAAFEALKLCERQDAPAKP